MSLAASIIAYEAAPSDPVAKLAMIELADWADEACRAPVVISHIAKFAGVSDVQAEKAIKLLVKEGFINLLEPDGRGRRVAVFSKAGAQ